MKATTIIYTWIPDWSYLTHDSQLGSARVMTYNVFDKLAYPRGWRLWIVIND